MDEGQASKFVSSLVKSIQALCNGYIDFSTSIEVIGHIHLNIDRNVKLDYVLTEEVSKSISEGATVFASHSYHSQPPKSASDSSNRNRQKHKQSASVSEESDSETYRHSSSHFSDYSEPSQTGSFIDSHDRLLGKYESNRQKSCVARESPDRRRRSAPWQSHFERSSPAAAKRSRQEDSEQNFDLEVIEIKEEPDEEPTVFFGDSSSRMAAAGQDIQTPDFSNVVMESLDRVGKVEGTDLVEEGQDQMHQHQHHHQQPFPVMMHSNAPGMPSSSSASSTIPGPSLADPQGQSLASTSGMELYYENGVSELSQPLENNTGCEGHAAGASIYSYFQWSSGRSRGPRSSYWRNMSAERRAIEREKSRVRMQVSRARRREREHLLKAAWGGAIPPYS